MQTTTEKPKHTDGLALIFLRQQFYLQQLQLVLAAVLVLCILISVLAGMLVYFIKHPVHPLYFSTDKLSRLMVEPPLNRPIMSPENVSKWVANAIESAYSYDFINYREQFQSSQQYFTDYGWKQYMKGLETSNNLEALNAHKMIVLAKVIAPPVLKTQGVMGGRFAYKFEVPLLVTYWEPPYDEKSKFSNPLLVTVILTRQKLAESEKGLGIVQTIASFAASVPASVQSTAPSGGG